MTKIIMEEELRIVLLLSRTGGTAPVQVTGRGDYTVESDDLKVSRSLDTLNITPAQESAIKNFGANVLQQIKDAEGI